jgi:hypothetical protein
VSKYHLFFLTIVLTVLGLGIFLYKWLLLGFPITPDQTTKSWIIESHASFRAVGRPTKLTLFIPKSDDKFLIVDESFIKRGFGLSTYSENGNRKAVWTARNVVGATDLFYRAMVVENLGVVTNKDEKNKARALPPRVEEIELPEIELHAAKSILSSVTSESSDTESLGQNLLKRLSNPPSQSPEKLLLGKNPDSYKIAIIARNILSLARIPARVVQGTLLEQSTQTTNLTTFLEVYFNSEWNLFDLRTSSVSRDSHDFLPILYGTEKSSTLEGAYGLKVTQSVKEIEDEALTNALIKSGEANPLLTEFSLFRLPIEVQSVYRVLLLVPLGAFVVVFLRNIVGITPLGTFMPVLIALSFRESNALWGVILFSSLVAVALIARAYLEHLRLLLVPRLAAILTVVVGLMALFSILTHKLGFERGLSVALFPMVILTMVVERMSILWEEFGATKAIKEGVVTIIVSLIVYSIIDFPLLSHLFFVFPELLFLVLAGNLLLGRYTGYRLTELRRFKDMVVNK